MCNSLKKLVIILTNTSHQKYLIIFMCYAFIMSSYEEDLRCWYDENVLSILSRFKANEFSLVLICIFIYIVIVDIKHKWIHRFRYNVQWIFILFLGLLTIVRFRFSGMYDYVPWLWYVSYVDILVAIGLSYLCVAILNHIRILSNKRIGLVTKNNGILRDWPIERKCEDIFDLSNEAQKIADEILGLDNTKTWSLAITAQWGAGKTSFLNLIKENFSDKDFEILYFNPRDSKSFRTIQEDFFSQIASILSKYDSGCNGILKDYMSSLQLIDNRGVIEKIMSFYKIWDKEDLKEKLKKSFGHINKKVLVLIDDFDRLSKEEIFEVLKLIDSNAAFGNLIFLTAYDKTQVNKALGESNNTEDACFVDKFFNLEFFIPSRPYSYITNYIGENLCLLLNAKEAEASSIKTTLYNTEEILKEYLPTLRDAKRFINQFSMDYRLVRGDVKLYEYVLVQLIKYRYHDEYTKLFRKQYVELGGLFSNRQLYYLKKEIDDMCKIKPLLKNLFPEQSEKGYNRDSYKHIFDTKSFENYFVNQIYGTMRLKEMEFIFFCTIDETFSKLNEWINNDRQQNDIIAYLYSFDMDKFNNDSYFLRYVDIITYLAVKRPESKAYWLFMRLIYLPNLEGYDKKYNLDFDDYKNHLLKIITDSVNDHSLKLIRLIHNAIKTCAIRDDEQLIKDADIWPSIKKQFLTICSAIDDLQIMKEWLYNCIDHMELPSRYIVLDSDCLSACKNRIVACPGFYIKGFVFLGGVSSNPDFNTVACEPFWKQIFGDVQEFEKFISDCESKETENISLVRNFWELYKANEYKQIEFNNQGNVNDKIANGLMYEVSLLRQIKDVWNKIAVLPEITGDSTTEEVLVRKRALQSAIENIDSVHLNIAYKFNVRREISSKLESLKPIASAGTKRLCHYF